MKLASLLCVLALVLTLGFSIDLNKPGTLYYQTELECDSFYQGNQKSSEIDISNFGSELRIIPKDWLGNNVLSCAPIKYGPGIASDNSLTTLLGRDLMPMLSKETNQVNLYNCSYLNETTEVVFLVNGIDAITLIFTGQEDCQVAFGVEEGKNFTNTSFIGEATNPNKCTELVFTGATSFTGFQDTSGDFSGYLTMAMDKLSGNELEEPLQSSNLTCFFEYYGAYYSMVCQDQIFKDQNLEVIGLFLLDDGSAYVFGKSLSSDIHSICLQKIKWGAKLAVSIALFFVWALAIFAF